MDSAFRFRLSKKLLELAQKFDGNDYSDCIYTAIYHTDNIYKITWDDKHGKGTIKYNKKLIETCLKEKDWLIVFKGG